MNSLKMFAVPTIERTISKLNAILDNWDLLARGEGIQTLYHSGNALIKFNVGRASGLCSILHDNNRTDINYDYKCLLDYIRDEWLRTQNNPNANKSYFIDGKEEYMLSMNHYQNPKRKECVKFYIKHFEEALKEFSE